MKCATNRSNKTPFIYFTCTYYAQHGVGWCSNHYIRYDVLYAYVLSRLQYWSKQVQLDSSQLIHDLQKNLGSEQAAEIGQMQSEQARAENAARKSTGCLHGCMKTGRLEYSAAAPVGKMNR